MRVPSLPLLFLLFPPSPSADISPMTLSSFPFHPLPSAAIHKPLAFSFPRRSAFSVSVLAGASLSFLGAVVEYSLVPRDRQNREREKNATGSSLVRATCRILSTNVLGAEGQSPIIECVDEEVGGRNVWEEYCCEALLLPLCRTSRDRDETPGPYPLHRHLHASPTPETPREARSESQTRSNVQVPKYFSTL